MQDLLRWKTWAHQILAQPHREVGLEMCHRWFKVIHHGATFQHAGPLQEENMGTSNAHREMGLEICHYWCRVIHHGANLQHAASAQAELMGTSNNGRPLQRLRGLPSYSHCTATLVIAICS